MEAKKKMELSLREMLRKDFGIDFPYRAEWETLVTTRNNNEGGTDGRGL